MTKPSASDTDSNVEHANHRIDDEFSGAGNDAVGTVVYSPSSVLTETRGSKGFDGPQPSVVDATGTNRCGQNARQAIDYDPLEEAARLKRTAYEKALYDEAKARAAGELQPIVAQFLNQPIPSNKTKGRTIDKETLIAQDKVAASLMRRFCAEQGVAMGVDEFCYERFANWMLSLSFRISSKSYKKYKNCVVGYLSGMPGDEIDEAINIIVHDDLADPNGMAYENGENQNNNDGRDSTKAGVVKKSMGDDQYSRERLIKEFPLQDLAQLITHLRFQSKSKYSSHLANLIEASIITGLRPIEWKAATIKVMLSQEAPYGRKVWMFVANAKATNGRGNGVIRSIDLSEYSDTALQPVFSTSNLATLLRAQDEFEIEFKERYTKMMSRTTQKLWERNPSKAYSLYSCWHQTSANWKSQMSAIEVAALSGHAVPKTTQRHYDQKRSAWPKKFLTKVARPDPEEVKVIAKRVAMARRVQMMMTDNTNDELIDIELSLQIFKP